MDQKRKRTASITPISASSGPSPASPPTVANRTAFFAFGRFQPVTNGHALLFDVGKMLADKTNADFFIVPSATHGTESNPLTLRQKLNYMRKAFPQYTILNIEKAAPTQRSAWGFQKYLLGKGYTNITWVVGSDRHDKLKPGEKSGDNELKFATNDRLKRDPKSTNPIAKVSGTLLRKYAKEGNFERFKENLAGHDDAYKKSVYEKIRAAAGERPPKKLARRTTATPTASSRPAPR